MARVNDAATKLTVSNGDSYECRENGLQLIEIKQETGHREPATAE